MNGRRCIDCRFLHWEFWDLACYCDERHWDSVGLERAAGDAPEGAPTHTQLMRVEFKRAETCIDYEEAA